MAGQRADRAQREAGDRLEECKEEVAHAHARASELERRVLRQEFELVAEQERADMLLREVEALSESKRALSRAVTALTVRGKDAEAQLGAARDTLRHWERRRTGRDARIAAAEERAASRQAHSMPRNVGSSGRPPHLRSFLYARSVP